MTPLQKAAVCVAAAFLLTAPAGAKRWVSEWFPFQLKGGEIIVPVTIAGTPARAMLDTGSSVHMLDREFAEAHGIPFKLGGQIEVVAAHSRDRPPIARGVPIELFGAGVKLKLVPVANVPFVDLVIGTGVLRSFVMQIDYASARIRFASHEVSNLDAVENLEMRQFGFGSPAVRANVDGDEVWLLVDTGYAGPLILGKTFVQRHEWEETVGDVSIDALGAANGMTRFRVPLLQLGPYDLRGVVAAVPGDGGLPSALTGGSGARIAGILGNEVLRHFLVTIDLKNMRMHLGPLEKAEVESWEWSGPQEDPPPEQATPETQPEE